MTRSRAILASLLAIALQACDSSSVQGCIGPLCFIGTNENDCADNGLCLCPLAADLDAELASALSTRRATQRSCGSVSYPATDAMNWDATLDAAAEVHADDMRAFAFTDPVGSNGLSVTDRVAAEATAGFAYDGTLFQLVTESKGTLDAALNTWLDIPAACTSLMSDAVTHAGIACSGNTQNAAREINRWSLVLGGE